MARQRSIFVTGKIANLIFYHWKGIPCVRTMPVRVRQTAATRASAGVFGQATSISKYLRESLQGFLPDYKDKPFTFKLNEEVRKWLTYRQQTTAHGNKGLPLVNWLDFNSESRLEGRCNLKLEFDWELPGTVRITLPNVNPLQHLSAQAHTETILFRFAIGGCAISEERSIKKEVAEVRIPYENTLLPAQTITIPFTANGDTLTVLALEMKYERENKQASKITGVVQRIARSDERWTPCGILASHYYP